MDIQSNDFALLGLPERYAQDIADIDARWKALQRQAHPDRFAAQGAAAQRVAMQWSARINEARRRLTDPLARAAYLCELRGAPIRAEDNTAMPPDFLARQLAWREALDEADTPAALDTLRAEVDTARRAALAALEWLLDEQGNAPAAAAQVRALMFIDRFADNLEQRQESLPKPI
ncbi:MAG: Fe-S protein assembly co-chaperone HscB [Burkholderiaceae bacterium]|nr:Fe-S protein assembly co-chaperone HscB [Burkholderiaceae bacterium]